MSEVESNFSFDYEEDLPGSDFSFEEDLESGVEDIGDDDKESIEVTCQVEESGNEDILRRHRVIYRPRTLKNFVQVFFLEKTWNLKSKQLPQCDFDDILVMLHYTGWQEEETINSYYDNCHRLRKVIGLPEHSEKKNSLVEGVKFDCPVCCNTFESATVFSLSCGHKFCLQCYLDYISSFLHNGTLIRCISLLCSLTIPHEDLEFLLYAPRIGKEEARKVAKNFDTNSLLASAAKAYIESNKSRWKWCPAPDCSHLTELIVRKNYDKNRKQDCDILNFPIVTCPADHEFCFDCQYENHLPCPCWIVKLWIKKCKDDSETTNWIQANTQACPQCDSLIEKNGGCNHMTCYKCKYEFCWICMTSWKEHGTSYYKCNRFNPEETEVIKKTQQLKRLSLQRYLHFYKRFAVHESSMKGDQRIIDKVDNKMRLYMEEELRRNYLNRPNLSWIDVQFLHDAIKALTNGRKTLKWTYCFAFYLSTTNFSEIFEQMQDYLSKTVEDLSQIFEVVNNKKNKDNNSLIIMKHKRDIINLSNLVVKRQKLLIECAYSGLQQGYLLFETE